MDSPIRAVIFDCEGVLVDSEPLMMDAWRSVSDEWLRETAPPDDALRALIGRREADVLPAFLRTWFPHREVAEAIRTLAQHYHRRVREASLQSFPHAANLLRQLRDRGILYACVSPYRLDLLLFHLQQVGLLDEFAVCVGGDEVAAGPPAPDLILEASRRLGVAPKDCLMVEDTPVGIQAAHAAHVAVVAVCSTFGPSALADAHAVIPSLGRLNPTLSGEN